MVDFNDYSDSDEDSDAYEEYLIPTFNHKHRVQFSCQDGVRVMSDEVSNPHRSEDSDEDSNAEPDEDTTEEDSDVDTNEKRVLEYDERAKILTERGRSNIGCFRRGF